MKQKRSRLGLSILAGGMSFVGAANATDLIVNGSFELPAGGAGNFGGHCGDFGGNLCTGGSSSCTGPLGWQSFAQYNYSLAYYDGPPIPASENPGDYYSFRQAAGWTEWGHFQTPQDPTTFMNLNMGQYAASETVALTDAVSAADIDSGQGHYTFSAWLASYSKYSEQPFLVLQFFNNASGKPDPTNFLSTAAIFDRTTSYPYAAAFANTNDWYNPGNGTNIPLDLSTDHQWIKYVATGVIPAGARQATVYLTRSPNASTGGTDNGGNPSAQTYVDLVKLDVTGAAAVAPTVTVPPTNQVAAVGNAVNFSVAATGTSPTYQWRHSETNLPGRTTAVLTLPQVAWADAGHYDVVVTNSAGAVTSTPPAVLTVINPAVFVTGQWDFLASNLVATCGADLQYFDATVQGDTTFGTTAGFGIANLGGQAVTVMHFTPSVASWGGYKMFHRAKPNGGGAYVNQFTLVFDVYYPPAADGQWRSLLQTSTGNSGENDGDLFVNPDNGLGITGVYNGTISAGAWHRLAAAFDLAGPGEAPVLTKFVDGVKVGNQTTGLSAVDDRFALDTYALLFADNDGDVAEAYVSSVQFSNGRRPDAFLEALGGPSASKIPGVITAQSTGSGVVISWTGGVPLQSADSLAGPWSVVGEAQSPYTPPLGSGPKYFRPKIP